MSTPSDVIIETIIKLSINELKDALMPTFKDLAGEFKYFLENGAKKYYKRQIEKHRYIKTILHRAYPVDFFDIYVATTIKYNEQRITVNTVDDILEIGNCVSIIGEAGIGKSMLSRFIFLNTIEKANRIPLFIELRNIELSGGLIDKYINEKIFASKEYPSQNVVERLLKRGRFTLILDGYDEIDSSKIAILNQSIFLFIEEYPYNNYILTSRPHANAEHLPRFKNCQVCPIAKKLIPEFVRKQKVEREYTVKIIDSIQDSKNEVISTFLENPLLLSLYILTYKSNPEIPEKRSVFYRRVIDVLFKEHDSIHKLGFERKLKTQLQQEEIENILKIYSFITYCEGKSSFQKDYYLHVIDQIKKIVENETISSDDFLYDLVTSIAIWMEDGTSYYFTHRSLQEYLAVLYIANIKNRKVEIYTTLKEKVLKNSLTNEKFNFLLLLKEIDTYFYNKFIYLPSLTALNSILNSTEPVVSYMKLFMNGITFSASYIFDNKAKTLSNTTLVIASNYIQSPHSFLFQFIEEKLTGKFEDFLLSENMRDFCLSMLDNIPFENLALISNNESEENLQKNEIDDDATCQEEVISEEGDKSWWDVFFETLQRWIRSLIPSKRSEKENEFEIEKQQNKSVVDIPPKIEPLQNKSVVHRKIVIGIDSGEGQKMLDLFSSINNIKDEIADLKQRLEEEIRVTNKDMIASHDSEDLVMNILNK